MVPPITKYNNVEIQHAGSKKIVRKVHIRNKNGHKTVSIYRRNKHVHTVKKPLSKDEIAKICKRKFVPGLFNDCETRKNLRR